jgi:SAM-dependent methyltransferase
MKEKKYLDIVRHYEACLKEHGDTHLGVDWPRKEHADTRYKIMLDVIRDRSAKSTLLDFGCGASHLLEYMRRHDYANVAYAGLDISENFIALSRKKFPDVTYFCVDILDTPQDVGRYDYIVMNGVFTEKRGLSFDDMFAYFREMILTLFEKCDVGAAFNVMSKQVDWERDDLFHLPLDLLAEFLTKRVTRHFVVRNDYGLYEYTVYLYRQPSR